MSYSDIVNYWKSCDRSTADKLNMILDNYKILFAYHSNSIEGCGLSYHQTREIFENGKVINYTGDTRNIFEAANQKQSYYWLLEKIIRKDPVTPEFIKELHGILNNGCYDERRWNIGERPGTYKIHDYCVGDSVGSPPEEVDADIKSLCDEINNINNNEEKILLAATYFHCMFESIHAFAAGNGRAGRTLMNYYLMIHDMPPCIIFDEDKQVYYMGLTVFDKTGEIEGLKKFIMEETEKTWSRRNIPIVTADKNK